MGTLRAVAFVLAEGVRLYLESLRSALTDSGELREKVRPVGAELASSVERGGG
jgi:hypothetical protein